MGDRRARSPVGLSAAPRFGYVIRSLPRGSCQDRKQWREDRLRHGLNMPGGQSRSGPTASLIVAGSLAQAAVLDRSESGNCH